MGPRLPMAGLLLCISALGAQAQRDTTTRRPPQATQPAPTGGRYQATSQGLTTNRDVILEIPELSVDSIGLTVQDVRAHV